jgi:zinc transporter, ZIP family
VDFWSTVLLGTIAGGTILLGLPIGRLRRPSPELSTLLSAMAVGVLVFLLWDVLGYGWAPVESAVDAARASGDWLSVGTPAALFAGGLVLAVGGLVGYESWMRHTAPAASAPGMRERRLAVLIAVGIGLHNLAEGLAIGHSSARGDLALAAPLVIGFALHNATEGFGIVAPLNAARVPGAEPAQRPSWPFLIGLGLIGGVPTLIGTAIGYGFNSEVVSSLFMALAAGSILYVVVQLIAVASRARRNDLVMTGITIGLLAGFATDAIVVAAGA